jgi:nicotinamide-nucleotide amidase
VSHNSIVIAAPPDEVFDVLDDAYAYPRWVVGARRVRHVDADWPAVGSRFHHAVGAAGPELHDSSKVLERERPEHLRLEVRFRPVGVAIVDLRLTPVGGGTRVDIEEQPREGPFARIPGLVTEPLLSVRNALSLTRLRDEVERRVRDAAADLGRLLGGRTVATAESCTGGLVAQALAREPGSGDWFRGGVVTYQRDTKFELLGVTPGPVVSELAAHQMAEGVAARFGADVAVSVTGAAGPEPHDGAAPGTVVFGVLVDGAVTATEEHFAGDSVAVCAQATDRALQLLRDALAGPAGAARDPDSEPSRQ